MVIRPHPASEYPPRRVHDFSPNGLKVIGPFGQPYDQLDGDKALILLEYFKLLDQADKYPTQSLQAMSPQKLLQWKKGTVTNGSHEWH